MSHRIHCPYCMRPSELRDVPFRCITESCQVHNLPIQRTAPSACDACGQPVSRRACPHCDELLPMGYCDQPSKIIALFGAIESGKSTFVVVLITELKRWLNSQDGSSLTAADDFTRRRYDEIWEALYGPQRRTPDKTLGAVGPAQIPPFVYTLELRRKSYLGRETKERVTLVFFDTAGEDLSTEARQGKYGAYLEAASGIVFVVDPDEFTEAKGTLMRAEVARNDPGTTAGETTITQLTNWLRSFPGSNKSALAVPACLVITKIDRLSAAMSKDLVLHQIPNHRRGLDAADREAVHDEVKGLVKHWKSELAGREADYRRFGFFAASALGAATVTEPDRITGQPRPHVHPGGVRPHRVIDPVLWLLAEFDLIEKI